MQQMLQNDFYTISYIENNGNDIAAEIHLNDKHSIFEGHFTQMPVVTGACMLQIIKEIVSSSLHKKLRLAKMREIKFLQVINPKEYKVLTVIITYTFNDCDSLNVTASIVHNEIVFCKYKGEWTMSNKQ